MTALPQLFVFFLSLLVVLVVTPLVRKYALRWKLGDKPNGRKIHTHTIPHVGGIGMVLGTMLSLGLLAFLFPEQAGGAPNWVMRLFVPVSLIVVLGMMDDIKNLRAMQKLTIQTLAAVMLTIFGFHLFIGAQIIDSHMFLVAVVTVLYLVGISSSVNLVDGHDGLAAGVSLVSAGAFAIMAAMMSAETPLLLSLALLGTCLGFLVFNFPPGKIFMGDTGSMFLGIMLGLIACLFTMLQPTMNTFVAVCFVLAVPMIDSVLAIARRITCRKPIFQADHQHMHHVLTSLGLSARPTLFVLCAVQAVMAFLGVLAMKGFIVPIVVGWVLLTVLFVTFFRLMVSTADETKKLSTKFGHSTIPSLEK